VNDRLETNVPGIFSCGNVLHVHDLADDVTLEAYKAAENAAKFIRGEAAAPDASIPVKAGSGVRYTVPSMLTNRQGTFEVLFRSAQVYKTANIQVHAESRLIKSVKKRIITPGEMERVTFSLENKVDEVTITVVN
jgi:hypothetical protein